jgi:hypothetical protein
VVASHASGTILTASDERLLAKSRAASISATVGGELMTAVVGRLARVRVLRLEAEHCPAAVARLGRSRAASPGQQAGHVETQAPAAAYAPACSADLRCGALASAQRAGDSTRMPPAGDPGSGCPREEERRSPSRLRHARPR